MRILTAFIFGIAIGIGLAALVLRIGNSIRRMH